MKQPKYHVTTSPGGPILPVSEEELTEMLSQSEKLEDQILRRIDRPYLLLMKGQLRREIVSRFTSTIDRVVWDRDFHNYLLECETDKIDAINGLQELGDYLSNAYRMSVDEWLDSLSWDHIKA